REVQCRAGRRLRPHATLPTEFRPAVRTIGRKRHCDHRDVRATGGQMIAVGLSLSSDQPSAAAEARQAEELGFDLVATGEHLFFHVPVTNAFVSLAAAAGATHRIRLLSSLTLLPLYPPALAIKLATTLDQVS